VITRILNASFIVVAIALLNLPSVSGQSSPEDTCVYCGAPATCRVCRLVCEKKKVPETVFSCECEDFCVPGRSQIECETEIDENGCEQHKIVWIPVAKEIRARKVLKKSTQEQEKTIRKLVVQKVCEDCACNPNLTLPEKDKSDKKTDDNKPQNPKTTAEFTAPDSLGVESNLDKLEPPQPDVGKSSLINLTDGPSQQKTSRHFGTKQSR
jgi:hypothetical protein